jgi:hypothetical protein
MPLDGSRPLHHKRTFTALLWFFYPANGGVLAPEAGKFILEYCQFYQFTPAKDFVTILCTQLTLAGRAQFEPKEGRDTAGYAARPAEAARLINLFDRYSPEKAVVIPPRTLVQDHM